MSIELTDREKALLAYCVYITSESLRETKRENIHIILDNSLAKQINYHLAPVALGLSMADEDDLILDFLKFYHEAAKLLDIFKASTK